MEYALQQSGCAWLVIAPQFKTSDYTGMIHELAPELAAQPAGRAGAPPAFPDLRGVVRLGEDALAGDAPLG